MSCSCVFQSCLPIIHVLLTFSIFSPMVNPVCAKLQTSTTKHNPVNADNTAQMSFAL